MHDPNHKPDCTYQRIGNLDPCSCGVIPSNHISCDICGKAVPPDQIHTNDEDETICVDCAEPGSRPFDSSDVIVIGED